MHSKVYILYTDRIVKRVFLRIEKKKNYGAITREIRQIGAIVTKGPTVVKKGANKRKTP